METPSTDDDLYELAPAAPVPAGVGSVESSKPVSAQPTLAYRARRDEKPDFTDTGTIVNIQMPLWLLGGGVVVELLAAFFQRSTFAAALAYVAVELILGTLLMLAGILLAARARQIKLGQFWIAVFKLTAISVAPSAVGDLIGPFLQLVPFIGGLVTWGIVFVLYFALLGALFDLDESDTWYCIWTIFLVRLAFYFAMFWMGVHI